MTLTQAQREAVEQAVAGILEKSEDIHAATVACVAVIERRIELREKWEAEEAKHGTSLRRG